MEMVLLTAIIVVVIVMLATRPVHLFHSWCEVDTINKSGLFYNKRENRFETTTYKLYVYGCRGCGKEKVSRF